MNERLDYNNDNVVKELELKYNTTNLLKIIDKMTNVETTIIDLDTGVETNKTLKSEFSKYYVMMEKEKITVFNTDGEKEIKYYINEMIITEIDTEKIIYDKNDCIAVYSKNDKFKVLNRGCYVVTSFMDKLFNHEPDKTKKL